MSDLITFDEHDPGGKVTTPVPPEVRSHATFSECRKYRYDLHRMWFMEGETPKTVMFLMMNPSTATEDVDDPTVRKCRQYAVRWGYNHLIVTNVMAYRATNPKDLLTVEDPVGNENLLTICRTLVSYKPLLVCAWGRIPPKLAWAETNMMQIVRHHKPNVLRLNKSGRPYHPLYLPNDASLTPWGDC